MEQQNISLVIPGEGDTPTLAPPSAASFLLELHRAQEQKKAKGAVLKVYLEDFKQFNDTFGYAFGEALLCQVAQFLEGLPGARVYRYGGVEFMVLLEGADYTKTTQVTDAIQERFDVPWRISGMDYMCTMSMGAVYYTGDALGPKEVVKCLDYAVTEASKNGQNTLAVFDSDLHKKLNRRQAIARLIGQAVQSGEGVEVRFRPTLSAATGTFTRAESYPRLLSPELGIISAAEFLPIAEDTGQICAVNNYMIRETCREIRNLLDAGVEFESVAVPISPVQFLQESFLDYMAGILEEYGIPEGKLAFELTESVLVNAYFKVNMVMQDVSQMGIEIVLNEFGTGYSGIANILDLPVDVLKLERMFIWQLETSPESGILIEGLINIAKNLDMKLIAEGVETEYQAKLLESYGCPYQQGFYYSPTITGEELLKVLGSKPGAQDQY